MIQCRQTLYLRIGRFLRNRRKPLRIRRRPVAACGYSTMSSDIVSAHRAVSAEPQKAAAIPQG